jgi:uncharacterized membrane protein YkoI
VIHQRGGVLRIAALFGAAMIVAAMPSTSSAQKAKVAAKAEPTQAELRAQAKVSEDSARAKALRQVPGGVIQSSELEREGGMLIYSFDIKVAGKSGIDEVNINAITGKIVAKTHETPKAERKEAKQEAREKAKTATGAKRR